MYNKILLLVTVKYTLKEESDKDAVCDSRGVFCVLDTSIRGLHLAGTWQRIYSVSYEEASSNFILPQAAGLRLILLQPDHVSTEPALHNIARVIRLSNLCRCPCNTNGSPCLQLIWA